MSKPKPFVSRAQDMGGILAAVAKLPGICAEALRLWDDIEIVVRKREPKRSLDQNRLAFQWCKDAAAQGDMTADEFRGYCKYHFGLAILCRDSEEYRAACRRVLGSLSYEQCIALMMEPHNYAVTRGMTKKQLTEYLDRMYQHFTGLGFKLTEPNLKGMDAANYREAA